MQLNSSAINEEELNGGVSLVTAELTAAELKTSTNVVTLGRTQKLQITSLDFSRQVFQITRQNHQDVAAFDFAMLPDAVVSKRVSLDVASFGAVAANDISFVRANHLAEYALDFSPQPVQPTSSTTLGAAALNTAGEAIAVIRTVALNTATLDASPGAATPASVVTLTNETLDFAVLGVITKNANLGEVVNLNAGAFNFTVNDVVGTHGITFDTSAFDFETYETQTSTQNNLDVVAFDLTPDNLNITQAPREITLTLASFNLRTTHIQMSGISSAGDRKRMLFGVGR